MLLAKYNKRRQDTNSEVRSRAVHSIRKGSSPQLLFLRRKSKSWWAKLKETLSDSSISYGDRTFATCPHGYKLNLSNGGRYYKCSSEISTERGSTSCSSSDEETIKFIFGSLHPGSMVTLSQIIETEKLRSMKRF